MKQMKRLVSFVLAFCMVLGCVPVQAKAAQMPYKDLEPNGWYTEAVQYAYDNGLMNGVETDRFDPEGQTTRAMVVTVLHRMEGSPQVTGKSFPDVEKGFYYEQPVIWAQANNIVNGHSADRFAPNDPVTREQIATILFRYAKYQGHDVSKRTSLKGFADAGEISSWAEEAMSWAVAVGMIQGVGDNKLDSLGDATRAQIATLLMRYQQKFPKTAFQVTFDLQVEGLVEDESAYSAQTVRKDQKAVKPADPKPAFGQFTGWYTEPECRTKYNFSKVVTQDLVLYAGWVFTRTDADGDGLMDQTELELGTDPRKPDTDGDGTNDFDDDLDGDGLSNGTEVKGKSDPIYQDTDVDWLSDSDEINLYGTDPKKADTDNDGAMDSWELKNGFDPLAYNSRFKVEASSFPVSEANPVSASVVVDLPGKNVESLQVQPRSVTDDPFLSATIPGYLGSAYDFSCDYQFNTARMTFTYDTSLGTVGDDFQPRIYHYNEELGCFELLANQTVTDGAVSVDVKHFSTYVLLNKVLFDDAWEFIRKPITDSEGNSKGIDLLFVVDVSMSMEGDRLLIAQEACKEYIGALNSDDRVGLVSFCGSSTIHSELTYDHAAVEAQVDALQLGSMTAMYNGLIGAANVFIADEAENRYRMVVVLSDGADNDWLIFGRDGYYNDAIAALREESVTVYAVGVGDEIDESRLRQVSSATGGEYYVGELASDIMNYFEVIRDDMEDLTTDTNGDKIPDYFAKLLYEGKLRLNNGSNMLRGIDFEANADYDGDGLLNGEEILVQYFKEGNQVWAYYLSDPTVADTDGDGMKDGEETEANRKRDNVFDLYYANIIRKGYYCYEGEVTEFETEFWDAFGTIMVGGFARTDVDKLARNILVDYFSEYAIAAQDLDVVATKKAADTVLEGLDEARAALLKGWDLFDNSKELLETITKLHNELRDYATLKNGKELSLLVETYHTVVVALAEKGADFKALKFIDPGLSKKALDALDYSDAKFFSADLLGELKIVDFAGDVIEGVGDMAESAIAYGKVWANNAVFSANIEMLTHMRFNGERPVLKEAAASIMNAMAEGYWGEIGKAVGKDFVNMSMDILITVATKCNPYVAVADFIIKIVDKVTGISKDNSIKMEMIIYSSIAQACNDLITSVSYEWETKPGDVWTQWYLVGVNEKLAVYLSHLAQFRILGEKKFIQFATNNWYEPDKFQAAENIVDDVREAVRRLELNIHYLLQ